ncbi:MAG: hypothetical protein OSB00_11065 [Sphingomonas bacterium]|nr:hypothetical protein [Sphingomonas bacterium]
MFIGHYAPALLAAAAYNPRYRLSLGIGFVATQLVDLAFFSLQLLGVEHFRLVPHITAMNAMDLYDMPWTHSLIGSIGWAALFAAVIWVWRRDPLPALVAAMLVLSHWLFDLLVHRPDLTMWGQPPRFGLGLWDHPVIEIPLELALAVGTLAFYWSRTVPTDRAGRFAPPVLALVMAAFQAINWFEPQPDRIIDPAPAAAGWLALFAYLLLAGVAWWTARHRRIRL